MYSLLIRAALGDFPLSSARHGTLENQKHVAPCEVVETEGGLTPFSPNLDITSDTIIDCAQACSACFGPGYTLNAATEHLRIPCYFYF